MKLITSGQLSQSALGQTSIAKKVKTIFTLPWGEGWEYHEHSPRGFQ